MAPGVMTGRMNLITSTNIAMNTPGHSRSGFLPGVIILDPIIVVIRKQRGIVLAN
jgi:hypothetical protein